MKCGTATPGCPPHPREAPKGSQEWLSHVANRGAFAHDTLFAQKELWHSREVK
jgi:hypothetical protein